MARSFDGTNDWLGSGVAWSNYLSASAGTISVWYYPVGTVVTHGLNAYRGDLIVGSRDGWFGLFRTQVSAESPADRIWAENWDGDEDYVGDTYTVNEWAHWCWVHTGGTLYLYKNGSLVGSTASGDTGSVGEQLEIMRNPGYSLYGEGRVARLGVWNEGLGADEIAALGAGIAPMLVRPAALTAWHELWGLHDPEIDLTANGRNLTVTGATAEKHPAVPPFTRTLWTPGQAAGEPVYLRYPHPSITA